MSGGYITKYTLESILSNSDFTISTSLTMQILSSGTNDIYSVTPASVNSPLTFAISNPPYSNQTLVYSLTTTSSSNVYYQTSDLILSVTEGNTLITSPDLPCSNSATISILYSLGGYNGTQAPNWIKIDSITGQLTISAPDVSSDTKYYFYVNSNISGISYTVQKLIKLTVLNWGVQNCKTWLNNNSAYWNEWNSDYDLNNGKWTITSRLEISKGLSIATISMIGAAWLSIIITSAINSSSMASVWLIVNQVQLLFLLFLTRAFIPNSVENVISGFKFALNPADYIPFRKIKTYGTVIENFNYSLSDTRYDLLELKSDSSVYNTYSFVNMLFSLIPANLTIYILYMLFNRIKVCGRWPKLNKLFKWIILKLFNFFTFGYYLRFFLEMNQYFLTSSLYEIYSFNTHEDLLIISLVYSFLLFLVCLFLIILTVYLSLSSYQLNEDRHNKLGEFFEELKIQKKFRFYSASILLRKLLFIVLLVNWVSLDSQILIGLLTFFQVIFLIYYKIYDKI